MTAPSRHHTAGRIWEPVEPEDAVGRAIRRIDRRSGAFSPWAHATMVVPSRGRKCWLVTLWDGNVDVWRVDDPTARYEFDFRGRND
ncbi:MAG: hypothetical protein AAGC80_32380 [Rhodococcus sp. (in: high G+C Gram-positive bacteria)]